MYTNPVRGKSLVKAVIDEIIYQIREGNLKPGEKLDSQRTLAKKLNVGMGVVREAIQSLYLANIVDIKPGKGVYATNMSIESLMNPAQVVLPIFNRSKKEFIDFWNARMILERGAVPYIIRNIKVEDITEFEKLLDEISRILKENQTEPLALKDLKFHNTLINITNNDALINMYKFINELLIEGFESKNAIKSYAERAHREHAEILEAIKNKDEKKLDSLLKEHLDNSMADVLNQSNLKFDSDLD
jgi:GntR family transcriptional regulator, transcriptional repressor for pyruvate dehydrogenase complex